MRPLSVGGRVKPPANTAHGDNVRPGAAGSGPACPCLVTGRPAPAVGGQ